MNECWGSLCFHEKVARTLSLLDVGRGGEKGSQKVAPSDTLCKLIVFVLCGLGVWIAIAVWIAIVVCDLLAAGTVKQK